MIHWYIKMNWEISRNLTTYINLHTPGIQAPSKALGPSKPTSQWVCGSLGHPWLQMLGNVEVSRCIRTTGEITSTKMSRPVRTSCSMGTTSYLFFGFVSWSPFSQGTNGQSCPGMKNRKPTDFGQPTKPSQKLHRAAAPLRRLIRHRAPTYGLSRSREVVQMVKHRMVGRRSQRGQDSLHVLFRKGFAR